MAESVIARNGVTLPSRFRPDSLDCFALLAMTVTKTNNNKEPQS
jgi:hypothetical protein